MMTFCSFSFSFLVLFLSGNFQNILALLVKKSVSA